MRTLSANSLLAVAQTQGLEPVIIVKFDWGGQQWFATKEIESYFPWIINYSGINSRADLRGSATITTMSLVMQDDETGTLKSIMNFTNMETVRVEVYIYFDGLAGGTPGTLVFKGRITNPITWDEGKRTLAISLESDIKSKRVGFAIETGQFSTNNEIAVGELWPIIFGKPAHVKAVLAEKQPATFLKYAVNMGGAINLAQLYFLSQRTFEGLDLVNFEVNNHDLLESHSVDLGDILTFGQIFVKDSSSFPEGEIKIIVDGVIFRGEFVDPNVFTIFEANAAKYENITFLERVEDDANENDPLVAWVDVEHISLVDHYMYFEDDEEGTNQSIWFNSEPRVLRKIVRQEGNKIWFDQPLKNNNGGNIVDLLIDDTTDILAQSVRALPQNGLKIDLNLYTNTLKRILEARDNRTQTGNPYGQLIKELEVMRFIRNAFWESREDAEVRVWQSNPDIYVCNSVESSSLHSVWGVRKYGDKQVFVQIPKQYYTVKLDEDTNIPPGEGPQVVTTLRFIEPLDSMKDQGWQDDIYVTVQSTLSKNPAEVIKYIIDNYTDLDTDATSFANVAADLINYEVHFAILKQEDAIDLVRKIAFQSGVGLIFEGSTVKVVNLMVEGSTAKVLSETNIKRGSLKQYNIATTNLVTQFNAYYRETGEPDIGGDKPYNKQLEKLVTASNNVDLYGLVEERIQVDIFNSKEPTQEVIDFWSSRLSNSWRVAEVTLFHDSMVLEPFDIVQFTMSSNLYLGPSTIKGIIIEIRNPVISGEITYKILLEVKAGETSADPDFWTYTNIATPINPADSLFETTYDVQIETEKISLDTFIGKLSTMQQNVSTLGRADLATPLQSTYGDIVTAELIHEGVYKDPDGKINVPIGNPNFDIFDREPLKLQVDGQGNYYVNDKFAIVQAKITVIGDNYLTCVMYDDIDGIVPFEVALPYHLRRQTFDGQTIGGKLYQYLGPQFRRNVTDSEDQTITFLYYVGDIIYIGYVPNGTDVVDSSEKPIHYIDLNIDGRAWAGECN